MMELIGTALVLVVVWLIVLTLRNYFEARSIRKEFEPLMGGPHRTHGYVYVFRGRGEKKHYVKIGRARDAYARLCQHRTANPHGVELLSLIPTKNPVAAELYIHRIFDQERLTPENEWFRWTPRLERFVEALNDEKRRARIQEKLG